MRKLFLFIAGAGLMASCSNGSQSTAQQEQLDSMKNAMAKQQTIDSMNAVNAAQPVSAANSAQPVSSEHYTTHERHIQRYDGGGTTTTTTETNSSNVNAGTSPAAKQRKGMSPVATGAIIGAGAGAITGALVDKNKGAGALIGGVLGAGAGAGTGAIIKKEDKKKDAEQ